MKRKVNHKEKGITLVALVITIIILLILTGVTLNTALSENGLFQRAKTTVEKYNLESEKEALSMSVELYQMDKTFNEKDIEKDKKGISLNKKSLQQSWQLVKVGDKTYDEGWNFVEKGSNIEGYGQAKNSWLINYETGEIIQLEEDNYLSLSAGDMLAVKDDSLIINIDSSIIDKGTKQTKEAVEEQLGDGVTLEGFDFDEDSENSGITSTSFNFDGVDDYIKIKYNNEEKKKDFIKNGFTFEFYGDVTKGKTYSNGKEVENLAQPGGFCWCDGNDEKHAILHFNFYRENNVLDIDWSSSTRVYPYIPVGFKNTTKWHVGKDQVNGEYQNVGWNNYARVEGLDQSNGDFYFTITFSPEVVDKFEGYDICEQKLYLNGELIDTGYYYYDDWDDLSRDLENLNYFYINKSSKNGDGFWGFKKMKCYVLRFYGRALSGEEVSKNYTKSVEYHNLL